VSQRDEADLAAIQLLERLFQAGDIEFVSTRGVTALAGAVASSLVRYGDAPNRAATLGAWLLDDLEVRELYADDDRIEELLHEIWDPLRERSEQPMVEAHREDLVALLRSDPDNLEHRLVYGDWLQAQRDPFGELITRQITAGAREAAAYLRDYGEVLFGPLAEYLDSVVRLDWRAGFIERARLGKPVEDPDPYQGPILLRWLLEHRAAMLLRELELRPFDHYRDRNQYRDLLAVVLERPRPILRRLIVGDAGERESVLWHDAGTLARLDELLPELEILELHVNEVNIEALRHPRLRRLILQATIGPRQGAAFAEFELPRLEHFALTSSYIDHELGQSLTELELPALRSLAMPASNHDLEWLAHARWRVQLEELDLSGGNLDDLGARALARLPWPRLRRLDVSSNQLGAEGLALLAQLAPEVVLDSQRSADDGDDYEDDEDDGEDGEGDDDYYEDIME
jgi:uncharacterized protein (TIGR02996 family)